MTKTELQRLLRESTSTLKNTSKDDSCTPVQYMTTITEPAINFDGFMQKYINSVRAKRSQKPKSCDALLEKDDARRILIEFKNGKLDSKVKDEVRHKMTASCLCLLDTLDEKVDYAREKFDFILVYNEQKNPCDLDEVKLEPGEVQPSNSLASLQGSIASAAHQPVTMPEFEFYEGLWFRKVRTFPAEMFEREYNKNFPNMN